MCVIIDANIAHKFGYPIDPDMEPVVRWWNDRKAKNQVTVGGKLKRELSQSGEGIRRLMKEASRTGRLLTVDDGEIDSELAIVAKSPDVPARADDLHIIALARVSGARVLVSLDRASGLHSLFKNPKILKPRGAIYQTKDHEHLLRKAPPCKKGSPQSSPK